MKHVTDSITTPLSSSRQLQQQQQMPRYDNNNSSPQMPATTATTTTTRSKRQPNTSSKPTSQSPLLHHLHLYFSIISPLPRQYRYGIHQEALPCMALRDSITGLILFRRERRQREGKRGGDGRDTAANNNSTTNRIKKPNVLNAEKSNLQDSLRVKVTKDSLLELHLTVEYHDLSSSSSPTNRKTKLSRQDGAKSAASLHRRNRDKTTTAGNNNNPSAASSPTVSGDRVHILHHQKQTYSIGNRAQLRFSFDPPSGMDSNTHGGGNRSTTTASKSNASWKWESYYGSEFSIIYRVRLIVYEPTNILKKAWRGFHSVLSGGGDGALVSPDSGSSSKRFEDATWRKLAKKNTASHTSRGLFSSNSSQMLSQQVLVLHFHPGMRARGPPMHIHLKSPPTKLLSLTHMDGSLSLKVDIEGSVFHTKDVIKGSLYFVRQRSGRIRNVTFCLLRREEQREQRIASQSRDESSNRSEQYWSPISSPSSSPRRHQMNQSLEDEFESLVFGSDPNSQPSPRRSRRSVSPSRRHRQAFAPKSPPPGELSTSSIQRLQSASLSLGASPHSTNSQHEQRQKDNTVSKWASLNMGTSLFSPSNSLKRVFSPSAASHLMLRSRNQHQKTNPLPNHPIKLIMRYEILDGNPGIGQEISFRVPLSACKELTPSFVHVENLTHIEEQLEQRKSRSSTDTWLLSSVRYYIVIMISNYNNERYFCEREIEIYRVAERGSGMPGRS